MVTKKIDSQGHFIEYTNDYRLGVVTQTRDHNNLISTFGYDSFGLPVQTTTPDNNKSAITYSWVTDGTQVYALYSYTTTTTGMPAVKEYFDKLGRTILGETTGFDGQKLYVETAYNAKGQVDYVTLPYYQGESNTDRKTYGYDPLGRLQTETAPGLNMSYAYNGLTTTITDNIKGLSYTRESDASGALARSNDPGGDIFYIYNSQGQTKQINAPGSTVTMDYDQFGRQISMSDPNTGTYTYEYNAYGELVTQTDPLNRTTTIGYNEIGQITSNNQAAFNTAYTYNTTTGLPESVSSTNNISYGYTYGLYLRPSGTTENIQGTTLNDGVTYDGEGRVSGVTYNNSRFAVTYHYRNGYLEEIKRADTGHIGESVWKVNAMNAKGQVTQTIAGNGLVTNKTYDTSKGYLLTINTGNSSIQNLEYHYNNYGLMDWRKDHRHSSITETFGYDAMFRLNSISINGTPQNTLVYASNGNIASKTDAGSYTYSTQHPNAVENISGNSGTIGSQQQDITYTSFNKVNIIIDGNDTATFTYGPDYARKKVVTSINGTGTTRLYSGTYEIENINGIIRELYYVIANGEIVAIFEKKTGVADAMHYVHTDHLGSLNVITNQSGAIEQEHSYDAWGNRRNPATWVNLTSAPSNLITRRGFTGHEHMDEFGLINMNGRMYDPVLGRFLSPDPIIANPNNTQDYNRYSYVVNNPLMFTDPSGYQYCPSRVIDWDNIGYFANEGYSFGGRGGGGGGGRSGYSLTPHLDAHRYDFAGMAGYVWDEKAGKYMDKATGQYTDPQTAVAWLVNESIKNGEVVAYHSGEYLKYLFSAKLSNRDPNRGLGYPNGRQVYVTSKGNVPVDYYNELAKKVEEQKAQGITDSWEQRLFDKITERIDNPIGLDASGKYPQSREFYLNDDLYEESETYLYRGYIPQGETVTLTFDKNVYIVTQTNYRWTMGYISDVYHIEISMSGKPIVPSDYSEIIVTPSFKTRIIAIWEY